MTTSRTVLRRAAALVAVATLTAGCTGSTGGPDDAGHEVVVDYTRESVTVQVGDTLVVDFGEEYSPSIGDGWDLAGRTDKDVLTSRGGDFEAEDPEADGSPGRFTHRFEAVASGTTSIEFVYSYRGTRGDELGRVSNPHPTITVTVEGSASDTVSED